jgi:hypothetical protein
LELGELPHLIRGFSRLLLELLRVDGVGALRLEARAAHTTDNPLWVLVFLFLNVLLNQFGVETLQAVWLDLETIIEIGQVLNIVVHSL